MSRFDFSWEFFDMLPREARDLINNSPYPVGISDLAKSVRHYMGMGYSEKQALGLFQVGENDTGMRIPVMFPEILIHSFVAHSLKPIIELQFPKEEVKVASAGSADCLVVGGVSGGSDSLNLKNEPDDGRVINCHPYEKGISGASIISNLESMVVLKSVEIILQKFGSGE